MKKSSHSGNDDLNPLGTNLTKPKFLNLKFCLRGFEIGSVKYLSLNDFVFSSSPKKIRYMILLLVDLIKNNGINEISCHTTIIAKSKQTNLNVFC